MGAFAICIRPLEGFGEVQITALKGKSGACHETGLTCTGQTSSYTTTRARISPLAATTLRPTAGSAGKKNATRVDAPAEDVELLGRRRRRHWNAGEIAQVEARGVPE